MQKIKHGILYVSYWLSLFLWQELTHFAAKTAHSFFSQRRRGNLSFSVIFRNSGNIVSNLGKNSSLILVYLLHCVKKCDSVSIAPSSQWQHSLSSLGSQVCLCLPFSIAKLWSLSLYIETHGGLQITRPQLRRRPTSGSVWTMNCRLSMQSLWEI